MKDYALRNFIPIAGTGNREPCTSGEAPFRATLGFTPRWFTQRLGIDFSERWHKDPVYRYETLQTMQKYLYNLFPMIEAFESDMEDGVDYTCATLSGVEGAMIFAEVYGQEVTYQKDNWPMVASKDYFSKEKLSDLKPFDPETNPGYLALVRQMDEMERRWGKIAGVLNCYQGILNTAFRLRGQNIFIDMIDDPDFVHELFEHIFRTTLTVTKLVQERQRNSGFYIDQFSSANCVVNMISPDMYEEFVLPYDIRLSEEFPRYGIHTCNWDATKYLESMQKIDKMGYLDMGMNTDMEKARELFPDARRGVLYSPEKIGKAPLAEVTRDFLKIYRELGPCDIILADVDSDVEPERISAVLQIVSDISSGKLEA